MKDRMRQSVHSPRYLFVALGLVLIVVLAATVIYEGRGLESSAAPAQVQQVQPTPTPHPPTGRRWFWQRSLWQNPEAPAP